MRLYENWCVSCKIATTLMLAKTARPKLNPQVLQQREAVFSKKMQTDDKLSDDTLSPRISSGKVNEHCTIFGELRPANRPLRHLVGSIVQ